MPGVRKTTAPAASATAGEPSDGAVVHHNQFQGVLGFYLAEIQRLKASREKPAPSKTGITTEIVNGCKQYSVLSHATGVKYHELPIQPRTPEDLYLISEANRKSTSADTATAAPPGIPGTCAHPGQQEHKQRPKRAAVPKGRIPEVLVGHGKQ